MVIKKGRRMKRYLGLKRASINKLGSLEIITPGYLSGWVFSKDDNLKEVCLYIGSNLIAKAAININRSDVASIFPNAYNSGFQILLPTDLPPIDLNQKIKLIANNEKDEGIAEVKIPGNYDQKIKLLKKLFSSNLLGLDGNVDGIRNDRMIHGWARRRTYKGPVIIWLQSRGNPPKQVFCDFYRNDMEMENIDKECGFQVEIDSLNSDYDNRHITFSFDYEGNFLIPQKDEIIFQNKELNSLIPENNIQIEKTPPSFIAEKIGSSPKEFQFHWENLEKFNKLLDLVEKQMSSTLIEDVKSKKRRWFFF